MGTTNESASDQSDRWKELRQAAEGDQAAWALILTPHRKRLRRMVALRLDHRLRGRIDPSDVLQEAFLQAALALPKYLERPEQPVFLWLRWLTGMTLQLVHRRHLGVQGRDAGREVQLAGPALAGGLLGGPGGAAPGPRHRDPASRPSAPSGSDGSRRPSTRWTRWIARSWSSATSRI